MKTNFQLQLVFAVLPAIAMAQTATVTVRNPIDLARPNETIVLQAAELRKILSDDPKFDVRRVHVRADGADKDLLVQAVDTNDDAVYEEFLFQADFAPKQTRVFRLTVGDRQIAGAADYKTYGRFVRERRDDFAWENDRIAHRMYGKELETWPQEPLTSSSVDVWTKRVPRLIVNEWYMVDDYHRDHGEGGDFYSAGTTRGDGGTGIWANGKLYPSANFRDTRVYAVGPIRVLFELSYEPWIVAGVKYSEKKRISLDAGQNLDRFESRYTVEGVQAAAGSPSSLPAHAVGLRKLKGTQMQSSKEGGWMLTWEDVKEGNSKLGQAVLADPATLEGFVQDDQNYLMVAKRKWDAPYVTYAGFASTLGKDLHTQEEWARYVADFQARLRAPLDLRLEKSQAAH
jgi:hypothetical protein